MDYLEIARKAKADFQKDRQAQPEGAKPIDEGRILAVLIASEVLGCDIWFALDGSFTADDGLAVFYANELPFLATKDAEQLREIHKTRLVFPGSKASQ